MVVVLVVSCPLSTTIYTCRWTYFVSSALARHAQSVRPANEFLRVNYAVTAASLVLLKANLPQWWRRWRRSRRRQRKKMTTGKWILKQQTIERGFPCRDKPTPYWVVVNTNNSTQLNLAQSNSTTHTHTQWTPTVWIYWANGHCINIYHDKGTVVMQVWSAWWSPRRSISERHVASSFDRPGTIIRQRVEKGDRLCDEQECTTHW